MSQVTNMTIPGSPLTMASLAAALEAVFAALGSQNRGDTAPSNPYEGMLWWDSSGTPTEILKRYAATAGWVNILSLNTTTGAMIPYRSGTALGTMATETAADYSKTTAVVLKSLFDANTILAADADDTPAALAIAEQRLIGRITGGNIVGLTAAQVKTLLAIVEADITLSDNTTGDSSTSKHGFCPKLPNDTAKYLRGDGTWAAPSGAPGDASVSQAKLKTSSGEVSSSASGHQTLPGGAYGFYPQTKCSFSSLPASAQIASYGGSGGAYATLIYFDCGASTTMYAKQTYVTSSGEVFWIFLLRDRATGKVLSYFASEDHPCFGNGGIPSLVPHPFWDYDPEKHEILVVNPTQDDVYSYLERTVVPRVTCRSISELVGFDDRDAVEFEDKDGLWVMSKKDLVDYSKKAEIHPDVTFTVVRHPRSLLQVIHEDLEVDELSKVSVPWPEKAVTVGLPLRFKGKAMTADDWKKEEAGQVIEPVKSRIPRPRYALTRSLVKKQ